MSTFEWSKEDNRCFACGNNPWGLGLKIQRGEDYVETRTYLNRNYQGFKDVAHGGIVATLLDEMGAWAAMNRTGSVAPSYKMDCEFLKPVPLEEEIRASGKVKDARHGIVEVETKVQDKDGNLLARALVKCRAIEEDTNC